MNKKIIGFLIITLLITATVLPVAGNVKIKNNSEEFDIDSLSENQQSSFFEEIIGESKERANQQWITKVQQTSDGGYVATGLTETYGAGDYDAWLIKTDSNGNEFWNKTFGEETREWALGGQQTSDYGYIIVGSAYTDNVIDVYLIKTYENGQEDWSKKIDWDGYKEHGYFVQQTSDGGYIVCAKTTNTLTGFYDIWLIKTDSNGNEEWNQTYGGDAQEAGFVVREIDDGYIIIGHTSSFGSGNSDVWLIKTDEDGNEIWSQTYGGANSDDGNDVQQIDGGYIIIGSTSSYGDGDNDFYLIKTDENGNEEWYQTFDGSGVETDIEIMGYGSGMSILETSNGYIMMGTTDASYGSGSLDILVIETDENGNELWNQTYGGSGIDEGYWMNETSDGGYILCGATQSYGPLGTNGWLIKIDSNGNELWNKTFPKNFPPYTPSDPDPEDGETDVPIDKRLSWTGGDPNGDPVTYDVYFGTSSPPPKVKSNQTATSYNPGLLDFETEYFWKIVAWDSPGNLSSSGPIWSFTTEENLPPNVPSDPDPSDGETDVTIYKTLTWTGGDPNEGDTVTYDVYFGTSSPPPLVDEDLTKTSYKPDTMDLGTTYYWQIVSEDSLGLTTDGPIWSFTTEEEPNDPPTAPEIDGPDKGKPDVELCWTFHSDDPNGNDVRYHIDWGDGSNLTNTTYYPACTPVEICHTYAKKGTYTIKAYANDTKGALSSKSTFKVNIPRSRSINYHILQWFLHRFQNISPLIRYFLGLFLI